MYTQRQKEVAIKAYFKNQKNAAQTVHELGYPTVPALLNWIKAFHVEAISVVQQIKRCCIRQIISC